MDSEKTTEQKSEIEFLLGHWIKTGMTWFMDLPKFCEMPSCFNAPSVMTRNLHVQNRPRFICASCAKVADELANNRDGLPFLEWENSHGKR